MAMDEALRIYTEQRSKIKALGYVGFLTNWDVQTEAPRGSMESEAKQQAVLAELEYRLRSDPAYTQAVNTLYEGRAALDPTLAHEIEIQKKDLDELQKIPMEEYTAYQELTYTSYPVYVEAKNTNQFSLFAPYLEKILAYQRKLVDWLGTDTRRGYDVLLDKYEEGMTTEEYDRFFAVLREQLVPFVKKVTAKKLELDRGFASQTYDAARQKQFCEYLQDVMKFDKSRGVLKESEHPFTSGFGSRDVRITVHYYPENFVSSIFSVIHETGHGLYEQQCDPALDETFSGGGASMGLHESQSRFYENMIGRSRAFWQVHYAKLQETFPEQLKDVPLESFVKYINTAECSFVRTEADELTYPLHIMLRYDMEQAFMRGELEVKDFPAHWNHLFEEYFGMVPPTDTLGVLQDVHWAYGNVGYFPTYALGSAYAAQIAHAMSQDFDIAESLQDGTTARINEWLREHIHRYGASRPPREILRQAVGEDFNPQYYVDYLIEKYSRIYDL